MLVLIPGRSTLAARRPGLRGPPPRSAYGAASTSPGRTPPARVRPMTSELFAVAPALAATLNGDAKTVMSDLPPWAIGAAVCVGVKVVGAATCETTSPA